ncbi:MAG TPA: DUF2490 domain-containing protein [Sphingomonas sp.]
MVTASVAAPVTAQTSEDHQVWVNATLFGSISDKVVYFLEAQPRFGSEASRLEALLLRPAIGWKLSKRVTVHQGYVHVILPIEGGRDRNEERSFQQLLWTRPIGARFEVQARSRFEQRWRSDGDQMGLRLRQMIRGEMAVARPGGVALIGSVEGFAALNDTDWGVRSGFDQVRSFAGVEIPVGGRSTVEAGYMNQVVNQPGARTRVNHIAALNIFIRR